MVESWSNDVGTFRDHIGGDSNNCRSGSQIVSIDLVDRITGLMMYLTIVSHVDPKIEGRYTLEHKRAVISVKRDLLRNSVRTQVREQRLAKRAQCICNVGSTLDLPAFRVPGAV